MSNESLKKKVDPIRKKAEQANDKATEVDTEVQKLKKEMKRLYLFLGFGMALGLPILDMILFRLRGSKWLSTNFRPDMGWPQLTVMLFGMLIILFAVRKK